MSHTSKHTIGSKHRIANTIRKCSSSKNHWQKKSTITLDWEYLTESEQETKSTLKTEKLYGVTEKNYFDEWAF